jgi:hypothetical protein
VLFFDRWIGRDGTSIEFPLEGGNANQTWNQMRYRIMLAIGTLLMAAHD